MMVEERKSYGGTVEKRWLNSGTMRVEQWNRYSGTEMVEQWKSYGGTVEQIWWNSGTMMVEK